MALFLSSVIYFFAGAIAMALIAKASKIFYKKEISYLNPEQKHRKEVNQLHFEKINLKNRNEGLTQIIYENQRSIKQLKKENQELKEDFKVITSNQITILELLSSVTKIRDQANINVQIGITERVAKKYNQYNLFLDSSESLLEIKDSDVNKSD